MNIGYGWARTRLITILVQSTKPMNIVVCYIKGCYANICPGLASKGWQNRDGLVGKPQLRLQELDKLHLSSQDESTPNIILLMRPRNPSTLCPNSAQKNR